MTEDLYQDARNLAESVRSLGLEEDANQIHLALDSGSTGSEILMRLNFTLSELIDSNKCNEVLLRKARVLKSNIEHLI